MAQQIAIEIGIDSFTTKHTKVTKVQISLLPPFVLFVCFVVNHSSSF